ncbi:MAG: hypothetical protein LJE56_06135 [Acidiferrobacterales bacterium]|jgi:hypothetical protein|nr:hypothetical protein [Acidiferrobacterales bacterium]
MKLAKPAVIVALIIAVAVITAPIWGGCDFQYQTCSSWCDIRHFNSDLKKVACKTGCAADKVACLSR